MPEMQVDSRAGRRETRFHHRPAPGGRWWETDAGPGRAPARRCTAPPGISSADRARSAYQKCRPQNSTEWSGSRPEVRGPVHPDRPNPGQNSSSAGTRRIRCREPSRTVQQGSVSPATGSGASKFFPVRAFSRLNSGDPWAPTKVQECVARCEPWIESRLLRSS